MSPSSIRGCSTPLLAAWLALAWLALGLAGCLGLTPMPDEPLSFGASNDGVLRRGAELPDRGPGYVRARPGGPTRFGTPRLIAALERAAAEVERRFPGTAPLRIGDLSSPGGGRHHRHGSHRTGRDADVLFYMTDPAGRSRTGRGWLAYNRFGFAVDRLSEGGGPGGGLYLFDDARNWHFARTLLLDEEAAVQWLFVSRGVKARLLRYAVEHEPDAHVLTRAAYAMHQPADASPHDDHFHVRILCSTRQLAHGCRNRGPIWPWLRGGMDKPDALPRDALTDEVLARELLSPIEEASAPGAIDAGRRDGGRLDAGRLDAGRLDEGAPDAASMDAGARSAGGRPHTPGDPRGG